MTFLVHGSLSSLLLLAGATLAPAQAAPSGYYAAAEGLHGNELAKALHDIVDGHRVITYSWEPFFALDADPGDPGSVVLIYSGNSQSASQHGGSTGDWNREHIWPRSFGISDGPGFSDLHNLRPADVVVNSERGNLAYDDSEGDERLHSSAPETTVDDDSVEPRNEDKGDIARALFYMAVRYDGSDPGSTDLKLSDRPSTATYTFGHLRTLLAWHRLDPPDDRERLRNHLVFTRYQGNRNPFIDRPEFAELVFLERYPEIDEDGDGLPDYWEWRHFGGVHTAPDGDSDRDGETNLREWAAGTDPNDTASAFKVDSVEIVPEGMLVRWQGAEEVAYIVERSTDTRTWTPTTSLPKEPDATPREVLLPFHGLERLYVRVKAQR